MGGLCARQLHVCPATFTLNDGQENWLITQHINTVLPGGGGERLRKVTVEFELNNNCRFFSSPQCTFEVYEWQTSTIDQTAAANTTNYIRIGQIFLDGSVPNSMEVFDVELDDDEDGFYLALFDFGSVCTSFEKILVFYYVCPEETSELISRPEAIDSESIEGTPSVEGECVENSSTESGADPLLICGAGGQWQVIKPCLCSPGYQLNSTQDQCSGKFQTS